MTIFVYWGTNISISEHYFIKFNSWSTSEYEPVKNYLQNFHPRFHLCGKKLSWANSIATIVVMNSMGEMHRYQMGSLNFLLISQYRKLNTGRVALFEHSTGNRLASTGLNQMIHMYLFLWFHVNITCKIMYYTLNRSDFDASSICRYVLHISPEQNRVIIFCSHWPSRTMTWCRMWNVLRVPREGILEFQVPVQIFYCRNFDMVCSYYSYIL